MDLLHVNLAVSALAEEKFLSLNLEKLECQATNKSRDLSIGTKKLGKNSLKTIFFPFILCQISF
jgi:hypothetical protein